MVSRILLRLIEETIVPVFTMVTVKVVSLWFVSWIGGYHFEVSFLQGAPLLIFENANAAQVVHSYSNLLTICMLVLGLLLIIAQAYLLHDTHIKPATTLWLMRKNLTHLIATSVHVYHKALVWLSYVWLFSLFLIYQSAMGLSYGWVAAVGCFSAVILTWVFIADFEREVVAA